MNQPVSKPSDEPSMEEILASIRKIISEDDAPENPSEAVEALREKLLETPLPASSSHGTQQTAPTPQATGTAESLDAKPNSTGDDDILELTTPVDENGNPLDDLPLLEEVEEVVAVEEEAEVEEVTPPSAPEPEPEITVVEDTAPDVIEEAPSPSSEDEDGGFDAILEEENFDEEEEAEEDAQDLDLDLVLGNNADLRTPLLSETALQDAAAALNLLSQMAKKPTITPEPEMEGEYAKQTVEELVKSILKPLLKEWLDANLPSLVKWIVAEQVEIIVQKSAGYTKDDAKNDTQEM